ncbi:MAG: TRAP transporter small permease [Lactovum sp.]
MRQQLNRKLIWFCAILLGIMVIEATWQVVSRYIFNAPASWTDEILRFQLIWITMIGAPLSHGLNRIMAVTIFTDKLAAKGKKINRIIVELVVMIFAIAVLIIGGFMVALNAYGQISPSLGINMFYVYLSIPVSGILFVIYNSLNLYDFIKTKEEE